jgi:hypothetical protein
LRVSERQTAGTHTLIIDRLIDDHTAVVEIDGKLIVPIPRLLLPLEASSDAVLRVARDARTVSITMDPGATAGARRVSAQLADRLRARDPGGDLAL